jgi:hypothetical protein
MMMTKLNAIDRLVYMNNIAVLDERLTHLEELMNTICDRLSKLEVEQLKDIKLKEANKKTK